MLGDLSPSAFPIEEGGQTGEGRDFVVPPALGAPDVRFRSDTNASFGAYVTSIGDFDGDGFGDFAVREATPEFEFVHVRYGSPRSTGAGATFELTEGGARLLNHLPVVGKVALPWIEGIIPVGDFDADGISDFVVQLARCEGATVKAYLLYGGPDRLQGTATLSEVGVELQSPHAGGDPTICSGSFVTSLHAEALGDFDGDGFDDFMLLLDSEMGVEAKGAYLFYGRAERLQRSVSWASVAARLESPEQPDLSATGDINGDGLGDLVIGSYWLPGREGQLTGTVELPSIAAATSMPLVQAVGDLDGDGTDDVLVLEDRVKPHLFYGRPGLFDGGVDLSQAAARFLPYPPDSYTHETRLQGGEQLDVEHFTFTRLTPVADLDGDGDTELVASRFVGEPGSGGQQPQLLALLSGTASRLSGDVALPAPSNPIPDDRWDDVDRHYFVEAVFPVGDLDGDGATDLVTRSHWYRVDGDVARPFVDAASESSTYDSSQSWLNIHYGTPGGSLAARPR